MLAKMRFVPTTAASRPFGDASQFVDFKKLGYVEDEYFQYGTANVYDEDDMHQVSEVLAENAPYCTRICVRRPVDREKFSGNVVVEILNSSANYDIDRQWINSWPFFTRHGDIYIGISSKGHVVKCLKDYDGERYADINWASPEIKKEVPEEIRNSHFYIEGMETGLFWDMLIDLAKVLRTDSELNPIREYGKCWLYLTGHSQSTSYINRVVKTFAYRPENLRGGPLFDGYLNGGGSAELAPIWNGRPHAPRIPGIPAGGIMGAREPFFAVNTESETLHTNWYGDFDEPNFKFRTWQIVGSSHDSKYNLIDYFTPEFLEQLRKLGYVNGYNGVDGDPMDAPYEPVYSAAWNALFAWARKGTPAPHGPKVEKNAGSACTEDPHGSFMYHVRDSLGITKGGIRTPAVNYPTGAYCGVSRTADGRFGLFGKVNPYPARQLKDMYGSLENYRRLIEEDYTKTVAKGFLLEGDREAYVNHCIECAKARGLE